jgi:cell division protein FtsB
MRWLSAILIALLILLQYPLWLGKGGWLRVWDVARQLEQQKENTRTLEVRNAGLDAEVRDLKQGYDAIEERARFELGMIRQDEVFVQIPEKMDEEALPGAASSRNSNGAKQYKPGVGKTAFVSTGFQTLARRGIFCPRANPSKNKNGGIPCSITLTKHPVTPSPCFSASLFSLLFWSNNLVIVQKLVDQLQQEQIM